MTPPPAASVADMIRPVPLVADSQVNRDILAVMDRPTMPYWLLLGFLVVFVHAAGAVWVYQVYMGLGIAGYAHPIFWGVYIVTFVFWVGIAHAGTLISAILYLFRSKWRNAINRSAEAMTVFAVLTAAQFLGIHVGRIWKSYFILPYPNQRGLWVNFKSPLVWDTFAISTYGTISALFLFVGLIPDFAIARDRSTGWRKLLYTALALGWQGKSKQWKAWNRTVLHLSGLCTPLVLSVHSVVSWDFAMSIVPTWHATIFAPYFVAGAIFSGFAMVLTMMIPVRRIFGLEAYITDYHFDNMAKFILLTSLIVGYSYLMEFFIAWYSGNEFEQTAWWYRVFGPYWISTWTMLICNTVIPQVFWFKRARTHVPTVFAVSIFVNIGMWFERYVIIVIGLSHEYDPAVWGIYTPRPPELMILAGSFAFFAMFFVIFIKLFPVIAVSEMKELAIHQKSHAHEGAH
ncbi:MAG TPA: NrfD/PsrC family molybdoenzyme membrane anchor subunit [Myxococcota bacterium]|nr:NrfD/PsrC family molybdoenzyme membrane anchor subunit [Myxococcota bacterium]